MLVVFTGCCSLEIFQRRSDDACRKSGCNFYVTALQKFEKPFGVLFFLISGFCKNIRYLNKALLFRLAGKVGVTVSCLGFTGKCG
jgi:hypothetical protein